MSFLLQALAGAVGGFTAWLLAFSLATDLQLPGLRGVHPAASILVHMFFGALAAFVGTFLANSKEEDRRRFLVFCVLSGMAWRPVLDAGQSWVGNAVKVGQVRTQSQQLRDEIRDQPPSQDPQAARRHTEIVARKATELLADSASIPSDGERRASDQVVVEAVGALATQASESPAGGELSVEALRTLHEQAVRSDRPELARQVLGSLDMISRKGASPKVRELAAATTEDLKARRPPRP